MKRTDFVFSTFVALAAYMFRFVWIMEYGPSYIREVALSLDERPYVYRALLPALARALAWLTGIAVEVCLLALFVASAVGLYFAVKYLCTAFNQGDDRNSKIAVTTCSALFLLILIFPHVYDVPAAMFFTLSLGLLARGQARAYMLLFPVMTLNRETSFLMIGVYGMAALSSFIPLDRRTVAGGMYQVFTFVLIRRLVMGAFADRPGVPMDWQPLDNLAKFAGSPVTTAILLCGLGLILLAVSRGWPYKPSFLRKAFLILFPAQVILHVTLGGAWELRVYAESLPVVAMLALWPRSPTIADLLSGKARPQYFDISGGIHTFNKAKVEEEDIPQLKLL